MDDQRLPDLFSQFIPDLSNVDHEADRNQTEAPDNLLVESLRAVAGQSGGPIEAAVNDFLNGEGDLHEATRSAIARGGSSAAKQVADFLTDQFKLPPAVAAIVAQLLVKIMPSIGRAAGSGTAAKKKTRRKAKPKTAASSKKKPKKQASSSQKKPASKPKARKRPSRAGEDILPG